MNLQDIFLHLHDYLLTPHFTTLQLDEPDQSSSPSPSPSIEPPEEDNGCVNAGGRLEEFSSISVEISLSLLLLVGHESRAWFSE